MAILGALSIARSGLIATGEALSVTGNNIANVNTIAFKGSRSEFADLLAGVGTGSIGLGTRLAAGTHTLDLDEVSKFADLADGDYSVSLTVKTGDKPATAVKTQITGAVSGVDLTTNPPTIRVGDLEIPLGDVREVRAPAANA